MRSQIIKNASPEEIVGVMQFDTPINNVRKILSVSAAECEQAAKRRVPLTPIEMRRLEFQAANEICKLFGVGLD